MTKIEIHQRIASLADELQEKCDQISDNDSNGAFRIISYAVDVLNRLSFHIAMDDEGRS